MKKFLFLLFIVVSFGFVGHSQTNSFNYDVNGDGNVTVADVTAIYNYLLIGDDAHEYVDLALPSGTMWATMNIGASSPEEYGDYFAWGETTPKGYYDWGTYKWCNNGDAGMLTKYCTSSSSGYNGFTDGKTELDPEDDAATAAWGAEWRTPSLDQIQELIDNCTIEWTTKNGVNGRLFTSNINGASLFFPAAGNRWSSGLYDTSTDGYYWSRTLYTSYLSNACCLYFKSGWVGNHNVNRMMGLSVRAVLVTLK